MKKIEGARIYVCEYVRIKEYISICYICIEYDLNENYDRPSNNIHNIFETVKSDTKRFVVLTFIYYCLDPLLRSKVFL